MTYLPQNKIKEFREANKPISCPILDVKTDDWVVDHDHQTGMVRGVISRQANSLLGKVENFFFGMCKGKKEELPNTLEDSLNMLNSNTVLKNAFGKDVLNSYLKLKNSEIESFKLKENFDKLKPITKWERSNTLDC